MLERMKIHIKNQWEPIKKIPLFRSGERIAFTRNVIWANLGFGSRILIQTLYFFLIARTLGAGEFGLFSGVRGMVLAVAPFVGWGSGIILIKNVSRDPSSFEESWGSAVFVTVIFGLFLGIILTVINCFIFSFNVALKVVLPVVVGDFWGLRLAEISAQAFQAHQKLSKTSLIWMLLSFWRLLGAVVLIAVPYIAKNSETWSLIYMFSGLAAGITGVLWVKSALGWGRLGLAGMRGEWKNGFYYSLSTAASGTYNDIDKTFLSRFSGNDVAGFYSAAYRIIDAVYIPIQSLLAVSFPKFFQVGKNGLGASRKYALRLITWTLIISGLCWGLLLIFAPFIPKLLGTDYQLTPQIVKWLGPLLVFRVIHNFLANALTGADYQRIRSFAQVFIAFLNVGLNFWLIPKYGWLGAIWSSLLSDGGLAFLFIMIILVIEVKNKNESVSKS